MCGPAPRAGPRPAAELVTASGGARHGGFRGALASGARPPARVGPVPIPRLAVWVRGIVARAPAAQRAVEPSALAGEDAPRLRPARRRSRRTPSLALVREVSGARSRGPRARGTPPRAAISSGVSPAARSWCTVATGSPKVPWAAWATAALWKMWKKTCWARWPWVSSRSVRSRSTARRALGGAASPGLDQLIGELIDIESTP